MRCDSGDIVEREKLLLCGMERRFEERKETMALSIKAEDKGFLLSFTQSS